VIATKHKKEYVIEPIFSQNLGVKCITLKNFDTDILGTFTGEIERTEDALETVRKKCNLAMQLANCDMGIANEGSFGPHPTLGFVNCDDELLLFIDKKNNLEIWVRELSLNTNFNGKKINTLKELKEFAENANFPSHALILRAYKDNHKNITKGITDPNVLMSTFLKLLSEFQSAFVETDMRAMYNPTRMQVIADGTQKLVQKILSQCPSCNTPGFGITNAIPGLPCEACGFPTRSTLFYEYECENCAYIENKKFPHGKTIEEPTYCDMCNP
jgi:hypothetical protein